VGRAALEYRTVICPDLTHNQGTFSRATLLADEEFASHFTEDEWKIMRKHPTYAHEMLKPIEYLRPAVDIPYCHHEKWDGSGYPRGLKGEEIPLAARIFAVVDVFDALTVDRLYRRAWPLETAYEYIREQAGKHFDPAVVAVFMQTER